MDRRELLDKAARDAEERMLLSRVWDKWEQCRLRNVPAATDFLSPQEQASAQRLLHMLGVQDGYVFFGGYDGAERQRLFFLPDWAEEPEPDAVMAVAASWYGGDSLTHRDILGSLMGLGLTRGTIGDILMTDGGCQVLAQPKTAAFLLTVDAVDLLLFHLASPYRYRRSRMPVRPFLLRPPTSATSNFPSPRAEMTSPCATLASPLVTSR